MSDTSGGAGWWLASDGKWYPPESVPATAPPAPAPTAPGSLPSLVAPPPWAASTAAPPAAGQPAPSPWAAAPAPAWPGAAPGGPAAPAPYPYATWPAPVEARTSPMAVWALVLVIVLGGIGALVGIPLGFAARAKIRASGGALKGAGLALAAIIIGFVGVAFLLLAVAIPTFLGVTHAGPSTETLDYDVLQQVTDTGPNGFGATGVTSVVCQRPGPWSVGSTFTCVAYDSTGSAAGRYLGTVESNAPDGTYQWMGRYSPTG